MVLSMMLNMNSAHDKTRLILIIMMMVIIINNELSIRVIIIINNELSIRVQLTVVRLALLLELTALLTQLRQLFLEPFDVRFLFLDFSAHRHKHWLMLLTTTLDAHAFCDHQERQGRVTTQCTCPSLNGKEGLGLKGSTCLITPKTTFGSISNSGTVKTMVLCNANVSAKQKRGENNRLKNNSDSAVQFSSGWYLMPHT